MANLAMRDAVRSDFHGIYNEHISVLNSDLEIVDSCKRNLQFGEFGTGIHVRYKNTRYCVQRYNGLNCIVVRGDTHRKALKHCERGKFSAACKGARY